jgi:hypothetical protein
MVSTNAEPKRPVEETGNEAPPAAGLDLQEAADRSSIVPPLVLSRVWRGINQDERG